MWERGVVVSAGRGREVGTRAGGISSRESEGWRETWGVREGRNGGGGRGGEDGGSGWGQVLGVLWGRGRWERR